MGIINQAVYNNNSNNNNVANNSISALLNATLSSTGYQNRFEKLLGERTPQFISSLITAIDSDSYLQKTFRTAPASLVQASLKAAMYDLPIDKNLGYVYLIPYKEKVELILGYKGLHQLALRTGLYKIINVTDIREGELIKYNRLTEELELEFFNDDTYRSGEKIIGYAGYYEMFNGTKKTIFMSISQIENHKNKTSTNTGEGSSWSKHYHAMCIKTVYKQLIGKWGLLSIVDKNENQALIAQNALSQEINQETLEIVEPSLPVNNNITGE